MKRHDIDDELSTTGAQLTNPDHARQHARTLIADLRGCPIPELARLGRTLHVWRVELCAHFEHPGDDVDEPSGARSWNALVNWSITVGIGHARQCASTGSDSCALSGPAE